MENIDNKAIELSKIYKTSIAKIDDKYYKIIDGKKVEVSSDVDTSKLDMADKVATAKAYLNNTDYKMMPDYDGDINGIAEARAEARTLIRQLEELINE